MAAAQAVTRPCFFGVAGGLCPRRSAECDQRASKSHRDGGQKCNFRCSPLLVGARDTGRVGWRCGSWPALQPAKRGTGVCASAGPRALERPQHPCRSAVFSALQAFAPSYRRSEMNPSAPSSCFSRYLHSAVKAIRVLLRPGTALRCVRSCLAPSHGIANDDQQEVASAHAAEAHKADGIARLNQALRKVAHPGSGSSPRRRRGWSATPASRPSVQAHCGLRGKQVE